MAAYAALVSLMYIIEQIQHHPCPPISLPPKLVESLTGNIAFLLDFLEVYNYHVRNDGLESRIRDAAHAAEDVIESRIVEQILGQSSSSADELFYQDLQKLILDMDVIKKEVMEIREKMRSVHHHLHKRNSTAEAASSRLSSPTVVGFDDVLIQLLDKLTGQPSSRRQIIPIVGMGGIGKTTLARNLYEHSLIAQHFDIRAWTTISQEYSAHEILVQLLGQGSQESFSQMSERELGEMLYKRLWGRRYFIVMDDMWNIEAWEKMKFSFPNNNNGSGIVVTSRLSNIALHLAGDHGHEMNFLGKDISWSLLCKTVFGEGDCPLELEATGKQIAENCKGLPLSLVVIGGLLAKCNQTREYWEHIAENLNSIVNLENDAHCLNLLYLSYNHLPVHLKPCFLYFGVFGEDREISVSEVINLLVAEGFLKPISGRSLEEAAEEYLRELIYRNLILVYRRNSFGDVTSCKIHDLLRDMCLREVEKQKFLYVTRQHRHSIFPQGLNTQRRIALHHKTSRKKFRTALHSAPNARSLISDFERVLPSPNLKFLRVLKTFGKHFLEATFSHMVNLRFVSINFLSPAGMGYLKVPSSFYLLWNLHTLLLHDPMRIALDIWKMPQLRHVKIRWFYLTKSSSSLMHGQGDFILENLQTLEAVTNFRCSKKMVKRIPNIKTLEISYMPKRFIASYYSLNNLVLLQKLELLSCSFLPSLEPINRSDLLHNLTFPHSLKELNLRGSHLNWVDISTKIGSLPHLQVLRLRWDSFMGPEWETIEGQFYKLKLLEILGCHDLECWKTHNTHFPCLEKLVLSNLKKLKEIPSSIGDISTLQSIEISNCSVSIFASAKKILEEQEEVGNEGLQVQATIWSKNDAVKSLASHNFLVRSF